MASTLFLIQTLGKLRDDLSNKANGKVVDFRKCKRIKRRIDEIQKRLDNQRVGIQTFDDSYILENENE